MSDWCHLTEESASSEGSLLEQHRHRQRLIFQLEWYCFTEFCIISDVHILEILDSVRPFPPSANRWKSRISGRTFRRSLSLHNPQEILVVVHSSVKMPIPHQCMDYQRVTSSMWCVCLFVHVCELWTCCIRSERLKLFEIAMITVQNSTNGNVDVLISVSESVHILVIFDTFLTE